MGYLDNVVVMLCFRIAAGFSTKIIFFVGSALWEPCFSTVVHWCSEGNVLLTREYRVLLQYSGNNVLSSTLHYMFGYEPFFFVLDPFVASGSSLMMLPPTDWWSPYFASDLHLYKCTA